MKLGGSGFGTQAVHLEDGSDPATGAVMPPIHLSTTFEQASPGVPIAGWEYARSGNPTRRLLEDAMAKLDEGSHGLAFSSGSAVVATLGHLLGHGAHVVSVNDVYGGTKRFLSQVLCDFGIQVTYTPLQNAKELQGLIRPTTKMIWIESPTNPTLAVVDIEAISKVAHEHRQGIIVVVDNTFLTPYFQKPLKLGADIVSYSATKYINGHSDVIMGLLTCRDKDIYERMAFLQNAVGAVPSPFDCYLVLRGLRTLHLRMERHERNAIAVAKFLASHPRVEKVFYPGLESHPQYAIAKKQQSGFGGMVSFRLKDGTLTLTSKFSKSTRIFILAESLGGVESLIDIPAIMTHGGVPLEERLALGITDSFIRLSVGIEDEDDLISDLSQAIDAAFQ